ncbi:MAG: N-formylglutamate amidohydrolase [Sphingomonadales bacterium]
MKPLFDIHLPNIKNEIPLVFDSPHSGDIYPHSFYTPVPLDILKTGWDAFVEDLWSDCLGVGASLIEAHFPRTYIDPNRAPDDIDLSLIEGDWKGPINPTKYSKRGMGLIRRFALPNIEMYSGALSIEEVEARINNYHTPYHKALQDRLDTLHSKFGAVYHIDCHSMKSKGNAMNIDNGISRPDVVLGDGDGKCAESGFTHLVRDAFRSKGYSVQINDPYKGGYIIKHYSNLSENRNSIQIEINRALYMDEKKFERNGKFSHLKNDLSDITKIIAKYIKAGL